MAQPVAKVRSRRDGSAVPLDELDRRLLNLLQGSFPIATRPYAAVAEARVHGLDPIPTLGELFEAFPQARFNIDAKSAKAVALLADTIADVGSWEWSTVAVRLIGRRLDPRIAMMVQAFVSLGILGLVIARAVNVFS